VRRVDQIAIAELPGDLPGPSWLVAVDVRGNAFLRNMVRILVGTLVEAGTGERTPAQVSEILANRDRTKAGITAPPQGLELVSVRYPEPVSAGSHSR
jgi:tRNA pseudouridine38-40 synthase